MSATATDWIPAQADARRRFLRAIGARAVTQPPQLLVRVALRLSRHGFVGRTRRGLFAIVETWCDNQGVMAAMRAAARELGEAGYRVAFLPTRLSTRAAGKRQPLVIVPPGSDVEPREILAALIAANFAGVTGPA